MKTVILTIGCVVAQDVSENKDRNQRRYDQFMDMTKVICKEEGVIHTCQTYWKNYDDKKLWSYGCNGFNRGDRPMSSPGTAIFSLKIENRTEFSRFKAMDFPSTSWTGCTTLTKHASCAHAEFTHLRTTMEMNALASLSSTTRVKLQGKSRKFDIQKFYSRNQWKCNDQPGSCPRLLCECDLMFAQGISDAMEVKKLVFS